MQIAGCTQMIILVLVPVVKVGGVGMRMGERLMGVRMGVAGVCERPRMYVHVMAIVVPVTVLRSTIAVSSVRPPMLMPVKFWLMLMLLSVPVTLMPLLPVWLEPIGVTLS